MSLLPVFSGVCSIFSCLCLVDHCLSFVFSRLGIVLSVLWFETNNYPFGIFKLFLANIFFSKQYYNSFLAILSLSFEIFIFQDWNKMHLLWVYNLPEYFFHKHFDNKKKMLFQIANIGYCNAERYKCPPNEQYKY